MEPRTHWLFGDQLGPHFLDPHRGGPDAHAPVLMIEARSVLRRRRFHRAKAHLVLSAMRHRAAELGDRVRYVQAETYADGLAEAGFDGRGNRLTVCHPTSRAALDFVTARDGVDVLPARGFLLPQAEFEAWAKEHTGDRLRMEGFYRWVRRRHELLMDGDEPAGGDLEPRPRQPRAAAPGLFDPGGASSVPPGRGRDRRRGAPRPRPLGA